MASLARNGLSMDNKKVKLDPSKVRYDGNSFIVVLSEEELIKKFNECKQSGNIVKEVIQAAYELRHVKFGREYKKACDKFDKLFAELENKWD